MKLTSPNYQILLTESLFLYAFIIITKQLSLSLILNADDENWFTNWHISIDVGGQVQHIYRPRNDAEGHDNVQSIDFLGGLQQLQDIIGQVPDGKRIRAYGSKWSMSNISFVSDILIETWGLNYCKVGIDNLNHVSEKYNGKNDKLVFVQSGVMIKHLSALLGEFGLSLSTTGGSDGQRLVGAISTGTHGSSPHYSAMTEFVRGVHLVTSGTEHFFVQRETDPAVTSAYVDEFLKGAVLVESNDLFEAVLVSLGSFGIIHALLIEVEPLYLLRTQHKVVKYDEIKQSIASLDVGPFQLNGITKVPHWFQLSINPYDLRKVYVAAAEKVQFVQMSSSSDTVQNIDHRVFQNDSLIEDPIMVLLRVAEKDITWLRYLDNNFRGVFRSVGNALKRKAFSNVSNLRRKIYFGRFSKNTMKTHGTIFQQAGSDNARQPSLIPTTEMEVAVPVEKVTEVLDMWIKIAIRRPIMQGMNVRYVKGSNATFAFTRFNVTATVSMFGIWSKELFYDVEDVYFEIMKTMAASTIPHCWHWGKKQPPTSDWVVDHCYGIERRDAWIQQRELFLPDPIRRNMFSSDALEFLGLHT